MAKNDFIVAITQLAAEKNLPKDIVFDAVEAALASAYKKDALAENSYGVPFAIVRGRLGGSAMTAACLNALARAGL